MTDKHDRLTDDKLRMYVFAYDDDLAPEPKIIVRLAKALQREREKGRRCATETSRYIPDVQLFVKNGRQFSELNPHEKALHESGDWVGSAAVSYLRAIGDTE